MTVPWPPDPASLRAAFEQPRALTVGVEDELFLAHPETLEPAPLAAEVVAAAGGRVQLKIEAPASQLEVVTAACDSVPDALDQLAAGRRAVAAAAAGRARPLAAGVHPTAPAEERLSPHERYREFAAEYGYAARRQLVAALQVHVAVAGAERALGVYNALRSHLPELAALAANAPVYVGRDTAMASVRPLVAGMLPRQGVPPALAGWEEYAQALRWGAAAGSLPEPRLWWWELRLHPLYGTVEVRVPDAQTTLGEAAGVAAAVHALVGRLAARHDAGDLPPPAPSWRIEENRWSAARHGLEGELADLDTGARRPTREQVAALLEELAPVAADLGCSPALGQARELCEHNGAQRQREVAAQNGPRGLVEWLAGRFLESVPG